MITTPYRMRCHTGGALYGAVEECINKNNVLENASKLMNTMRDAGCSILHVPIAFQEVREESSYMFHVL